MTYARFFAAMAMIVLAELSTAAAHESRPLHVEIIERAPDIFAVKWTVPPTVDADNQPEVRLPPTCVRDGNGGTASLYTCSDGLMDGAVTIKYPRFNPSLSTLIRLTRLSGETRTAALPPGTLTWTPPAKETLTRVARSYLVIGARHILEGYDHLLFVVCLVFIAGTWRRILITVTGFTIAHSITLALAALGLMRIPIPPVEAVIALSIVFLATEIARPRHDTLTWRYSVAVSASFGLLHGFGFASALSEIGLPQTEIPTALLFFNLGVEVGQIAFVLVVLALMVLLRQMKIFHANEPAQLPQTVARPAAYVIGTIAAYWLVERVAGFGLTL